MFQARNAQHSLNSPARSCVSITPSQLSIYVVERNVALNVAGRIENPNLTRAKACAVLRVIDCLILFWEHRLDARCFKSFPTPSGYIVEVCTVTRNKLLIESMQRALL